VQRLLVVEMRKFVFIKLLCLGCFRRFSLGVLDIALQRLYRIQITSLFPYKPDTHLSIPHGFSQRFQGIHSIQLCLVRGL
jgi:hypothetical protein